MPAAFGDTHGETNISPLLPGFGFKRYALLSMRQPDKLAANLKFHWLLALLGMDEKITHSNSHTLSSNGIKETPGKEVQRGASTETASSRSQTER